MSAAAPPAPAPARHVHVLKSVRKTFEDTWRGDKRHEIRTFDRGYVVGDAVLLIEFHPVTRPTGAQAGPLGWWGNRVILGEITNLTGPGTFGLPQSLCVFSLGKLVCLASADQHDETRPPVPWRAARATLPADILSAWSDYNPRALRVVGLPDGAQVAPPAPAPAVRRPARKKPIPRKKGARRR